ncbi:MAG: hypothetical protein LBF37_04290 [Rickettsiales bacterium]|jgi:hypothetical protein|nr:hypothetical protein [Rickettsiales bacterium]
MKDTVKIKQDIFDSAIKVRISSPQMFILGTFMFFIIMAQAELYQKSTEQIKNQTELIEIQKKLLELQQKQYSLDSTVHAKQKHNGK